MVSRLSSKLLTFHNGIVAASVQEYAHGFVVTAVDFISLTTRKDIGCVWKISAGNVGESHVQKNAA